MSDVLCQWSRHPTLASQCARCIGDTCDRHHYPYGAASCGCDAAGRHDMTVIWRVADEDDGVRPVRTACKGEFSGREPWHGRGDIDGRTMYINTHFATEDEAWERMLANAQAAAKMDRVDAQHAELKLEEIEARAEASRKRAEAMLAARSGPLARRQVAYGAITVFVNNLGELEVRIDGNHFGYERLWVRAADVDDLAVALERALATRADILKAGDAYWEAQPIRCNECDPSFGCFTEPAKCRKKLQVD